MSEDKFVENFYDTTAYTADISTKMRIPEHINAHGSYRYTGVSDVLLLRQQLANGEIVFFSDSYNIINKLVEYRFRNGEIGGYSKDYPSNSALYDMQVPDR